MANRNSHIRKRDDGVVELVHETTEEITDIYMIERKIYETKSIIDGYNQQIDYLTSKRDQSQQELEHMKRLFADYQTLQATSIAEIVPTDSNKKK